MLNKTNRDCSCHHMTPPLPSFIGESAHMLIIMHQCPETSTSHSHRCHIPRPLLCVRLPMITITFHWSHTRRPPTDTHTHTHKTPCVLTSPVYLRPWRFLHLPPITALSAGGWHRDQRWNARVTVLLIERRAVPVLIFKKATPLSHEGNMVAWIRAIWAN